MDKQMAPTSQMFSHGGILIRDWFSDRLQQKHGSWVTLTPTGSSENHKAAGLSTGSPGRKQPRTQFGYCNFRLVWKPLSKAATISLSSILESLQSARS